MSSKRSSLVIFLLVLLSINLLNGSNSSKNSKSLSKTRTECSSEMGVDGTCLSMTTLTNLILPDGDVEDSYNNMIKPILEQVLGQSPSLCWGDFIGSDFLGDNVNLDNALCSTMALIPDQTYSGVSFYGPALPCAGGETSMCFTFDSCGSFGLAFSGGVVSCLATASGIGNILKLVDAALQHVSFGFSYYKKFQLTVEIPVLTDGKINFQTIDLHAHYFDSLGLAFPTNIKRLGKKISELIEISATVDRFINFGAIDSVSELIASIKSNDVSASLKSILDLAMEKAQMNVYKLSGAVTFALSSLTQNFLGDISVSLPTAYMVDTGSENDYGLDAGKYYAITTDIVGSLVDAFDGIFGHFEGVLDYLGISLPSTSGLNVKLGVFLGVYKAGIAVELPSFKLYCSIDISSFQASCQVNSSFFSALIEGLVWVFKKASKLFDMAGEEIARVGKSVAKFTKSVFKSGVKGAKKLGCKISAALFGSKCNKSYNPYFVPGDGSIFRFKKDDDNNDQLGVNTACVTNDHSSSCVLTLETNTNSNQWRQYWEFTGDHKICNTLIDNSLYGEQINEDNRKCISGDDGWKNIRLDTYANAISFEIFKKDNHRFSFCKCNYKTRSNCKNCSPKYAIYVITTAESSWTSLNSHSNFISWELSNVQDY